MNAFDRVCRATGIFLLGSALSWMVTFGVMFLIEATHHGKAVIPWAHNQGGWIVAPIFLSIIILILAIASSLKIDN